MDKRAFLISNIKWRYQEWIHLPWKTTSKFYGLFCFTQIILFQNVHRVKVQGSPLSNRKW